MRLLRAILLVLISLIPLVSLFHKNDVRRWDVQRSAMAGPDEFSYLLMAQHFMEGGGLSLEAELGRDTFYPPGYPLLLAAWGKCFGLTMFTAHAFNTFLLCLCTACVYFLSRRLMLLVSTGGHRRFVVSADAAAWFALLIAALFATNWHILETSLLLMSEPAFMLALFGWLAVALRWPRWHERPALALVMAVLATVTWSIRGAGIVCVVATVCYPILAYVRSTWNSAAPPRTRRLAAFILVLAIPLCYQITLRFLAPEKSLASGQSSANSYTQQLTHGITDGGHLSPFRVSDYPSLVENLGKLTFSHLNDFAASFVPWPRENPDFHLRTAIGRIFAILALLSFFYHLIISMRHQRPNAQFLLLFLLLYIALYLLWPFNFARFWSPILPLMCVFLVDALNRFMRDVHRLPRLSVPATLLALLLVLSARELSMQLGNYARRLNYVSDSLADASKIILRESPDPAKTRIAVITGDELFALAWHLSQQAPPGTPRYRIDAPIPNLPGTGKSERADDMLLRLVDDVRDGGDMKLFFFAYFPNIDTRDTLASLNVRGQGAVEPQRIHRRSNIVSLWEIVPIGPVDTNPRPRQ